MTCSKEEGLFYLIIFLKYSAVSLICSMFDFVWSVCAGSPHLSVVEGLVCLSDPRGFVVGGLFASDFPGKIG